MPGAHYDVASLILGDVAAKSRVCKGTYIAILVINLNFLAVCIFVLDKELIILSKTLTIIGKQNFVALGHCLAFPFLLKSVGVLIALEHEVLSIAPEHATQGNCGEEKSRFLD